MRIDLKKLTVQLSEEPRRRAGLNLPYGLVRALPKAELLLKKLLTVTKKLGL